MTKELTLKGGETVLVDDEDYERLSAYVWRASKKPASRTVYALRGEYLGGGRSGPERRTILLHRAILGLSGSEVADHINGNGLDNRKANLRVCTRSQNAVNWQRRHRAVSPYRGLRRRPNGQWHVVLTAEGRCHSFGSYSDPELAARIYDREARRLHGEFAVLNFPGD